VTPNGQATRDLARQKQQKAVAKPVSVDIPNYAPMIGLIVALSTY
jgi:hypothetical protein